MRSFVDSLIDLSNSLRLWLVDLYLLSTLEIILSVLVLPLGGLNVIELTPQHLDSGLVLLLFKLLQVLLEVIREGVLALQGLRAVGPGPGQSVGLLAGSTCWWRIMLAGNGRVHRGEVKVIVKGRRSKVK